ncbi:hypothetical protein Pmani_004696 [Petrolisthes manimaculis]|uniref:DNA-directed RNA polymerase I subunit D n=1 Tax=Petrolisthes manimaculis TaxID=1843537 RepID=A0AAE1Q9Y6_9EUCA|nr:hypothetical protein Pmani_007919 [Petrolisthes manimaculis]KAK4324697.1 hypothetical protein Pmani_004696 [Petrolisthes manimaculis]
MPIGADGFRLPTVNEPGSKNKLEMIRGAGQDEYCRTFVINEEDHTLGNALKHVLMQHPAVEVCGYTVPHPMERSIHVRVQTKGVPAIQVLHQSLTTLKNQNQMVKQMIQDEVTKYKEDNSSQ